MLEMIDHGYCDGKIFIKAHRIGSSHPQESRGEIRRLLKRTRRYLTVMPVCWRRLLWLVASFSRKYEIGIGSIE
jgi:hypothetical protein